MLKHCIWRDLARLNLLHDKFWSFSLAAYVRCGFCVRWTCIGSAMAQHPALLAGAGSSLELEFWPQQHSVITACNLSRNNFKHKGRALLQYCSCLLVRRNRRKEPPFSPLPILPSKWTVPIQEINITSESTLSGLSAGIGTTSALEKKNRSSSPWNMNDGDHHLSFTDRI